MRAPILAIPGTLCDERLFAPLAARLAGVQPLPPIADADVGAAADRLLAAAPTRFVALGFSLGGFVALEVLRRAPQRLAGVVMVASNALPAAPALVTAKAAELALVAEQGLPALIDSLWPRYVAPARSGDATLKALVLAMAKAVGPERLALQNALACLRPDSRALLTDSLVPVLAVAGAHDPLCPPERAACAGARGTNIVLPDTGHFVPLEAPDALATAIAAWRPE